MMGMRAKKICMAMLLIVGGIVAVFLAHRKVAEKITEEEYQRFLDGEVPAMKENGKTYFLEDLFGEDVSDVETFLSDIDGDGVIIGRDGHHIMRLTILQDLKKMEQWWKDLFIDATTVTRMERLGWKIVI